MPALGSPYQRRHRARTSRAITASLLGAADHYGRGALALDESLDFIYHWLKGDGGRLGAAGPDRAWRPGAHSRGRVTFHVSPLMGVGVGYDNRFVASGNSARSCRRTDTERP